jgi:hypothetical protein
MRALAVPVMVRLDQTICINTNLRAMERQTPAATRMTGVRL